MSRNRLGWCVLLGVLYLGLMGAGSCGKKARDQIGSAKTAIESARAAEAERYATEEFRSAEESLLLAQQQYEKNRFKKSEESARTSETQAKLALEKALEAKARSEAEERRRQEEEALLASQRSSLYDQQSEADLAKMALHDVHFEYDASVVSKAAQGVIALNCQWLSEHSTVRVEIEGHCDERGTEEYNLALGAKRAKVVYDAMVKCGVDASRMKTISYGESVPIDPGHSEDAWAKNRRAHFAAIQ